MHRIRSLESRPASRGTTPGAESTAAGGRGESRGPRATSPVPESLARSFDLDFSQVRLHADEEGDRVAGAFHARALNVGNDLFFRAGEYAPETDEGQRLLAHELAHVAQRRSGAAPSHLVSSRGDVAEADAWSAADAAMAGESVSVSGGPGALVACDSIWSTLSDVINVPKDVMGVLEEVEPVTAVLGAIGNVDKMMSADDEVEASSGALGTLGNVLTLAKTIGSDTLGETGNILGGAAGLLGAGASGLDAYGDFSEGNYVEGGVNSLKAVGGTLSGLAGLAGFELSSVAGMSAGTALGGGGASGLAALGPLGAVIGAGTAGYGVGTLLAEHTSVGGHTVDSMGRLDAMLTEEGERPWALRTSEEMEEDWDEGNYLDAIGGGAKLAGMAGVGALAGLGGGIVDVGESIYDLF